MTGGLDGWKREIRGEYPKFEILHAKGIPPRKS
jgi:hypothetical protein